MLLVPPVSTTQEGVSKPAEKHLDVKQEEVFWDIPAILATLPYDEESFSSILMR